MPFTKTSDALTPPQPLTDDEKAQVVREDAWEVGQVHPSDSGLVWDGERWIPRAEWESRKVDE